MVLLHGLGASWRVWRPVLAPLAERFDLLAPTLPGHLGGPSLPGPVTATALVEGTERLLDAEGIARAHLVGNSLGGRLALELASRERALSVVSLAPIGCFEGRERARLVRRLRASQRLASSLRPVALLLAGAAAGRRLLFGDVVYRPGRLAASEARDWVRAFSGCPQFSEILRALETAEETPLRSLGVPACVAWPAQDRMMPAEPFADRFARALPQARRARLPDCGHIPMPDDPAAVIALVLEHARSASGASAEARARS